MSNARNLANLLGTGTQITTADIADGVFQANKNLIINGAMLVAQRGTSFTSTADSYTLDRFALGHGSPVNACTTEQSTDAPANFKYSMKVTAGTGASAGTTGYASLRQAIEGQNIAHVGFGTSAAKNITLSFWVKCSLTGNFGTNIRNQAGNRAYASIYTINSANTWEYKTVTIPADTGGTWPTDTGIGFHMQWDLGAGSNYDIAAGSWTDGTNMFGVEGTVKLTETTNATWQMTGVQLEVGDGAATPFEHPRSFGDELARCQRYYQINYATWYGVAAASGYFVSSNITYKPDLRANPVVAQESFSSGSLGRFTSTGATSSTINGTTIYSSPSSAGGNSGYYATWSADAEL